MSVGRAEERATKLLADHGVIDAPVPVEDLARSLGAEVVYRGFEGDVSGMVYRDKAQKLIGVNSSHGANRQRFTVAHEVGHLVLHKGTPVFVDSFEGRINWRDGASAQEESEANAFAAELLMPRSLVVRKVQDAMESSSPSPFELIAHMAKTFKVSQQSMRYRLENLGVLDPGDLVG
jgi:Zn-dependent peptidase ImmA (M78 family)